MVLSEAITYVTGKRAKHRVEFRRTFPVESREVLSQSFQSGRCEVASIEILLDRHKMTVRMEVQSLPRPRDNGQSSAILQHGIRARGNRPS